MTIPDGRVTIKPRPNIAPSQPHKECWRQSWPLSRHEHRLGDVRRCPHGKVQVLTDVGPYARTAGPGTHWWRTLSPIFDPITYRRARRALGD